jgi:two-component system LytT family response regulator
MEQTYNILIVEDDLSSSAALEMLIKLNYHNLNVVTIANNLEEAKKFLEVNTPDLAFFDIELPDGNSLEFLETLKPINFDIIFCTSFNEFAVRAFEFSAIHYLLKPVEKDELIEAVNRFLEKSNKDNLVDRLNILKESISLKPQRIMLPNTDGYDAYDISELSKLEAEGNYTKIYLKNGNTVVISKQLNTFEKILKEFGFVRIHSKFLINLNSIKKYRKSKNSEVILIDGTILPISQTYKNSFEDSLQKTIKIL